MECVTLHNSRVAQVKQRWSRGSAWYPLCFITLSLFLKIKYIQLFINEHAQLISLTQPIIVHHSKYNHNNNNNTTLHRRLLWCIRYINQNGNNNNNKYSITFCRWLQLALEFQLFPHPRRTWRLCRRRVADTPTWSAGPLERKWHSGQTGSNLENQENNNDSERKKKRRHN